MLDNKFEKLRSVKEMDQEHISMTINLILNLPRDYLTLCRNYNKKQLSNRWFFQSLIKNLIMFQDTLLKNNNELSNNFVTNLESYKKLKNMLVKTISFVAKTNKVL